MSRNERCLRLSRGFLLSTHDVQHQGQQRQHDQESDGQCHSRCAPRLSSLSPGNHERQRGRNRHAPIPPYNQAAVAGSGAPTSPRKGAPRTCRRLLRYERLRSSWRKLPYRQIGPRKIPSKSRSEKREVEPHAILARSEVPYTSAATIRETSARIASCFVIEPGASPR